VSTPYLGQIQPFAFNFAPVGWAMCNGQLLPISQNTALFALVGTFYGGDGVTNFALPNLQSRVAIHQGQGPGLSPYSIGQVGGTENVTLIQNQMPQHGHTVAASAAPASTARPGGAVMGHAGTDAYGSSPDGTTMNAQMIGTAGGNQPHTNVQPYLAVNFCIALQGVFPSRN
jgi:microcystin-dependent protein